ncbi:MAG TPA: hypothetical protein VJV75_10705 [Candidatus Polarisedimenticolia bacterium]|nr:hypothetical protein [Candidatus Polarisedimenticolia bacterium]
MTRTLRPIDRFVRVPLGFVWFVVLMILALPVMAWMTGAWYVSRLFVRGAGKAA